MVSNSSYERICCKCNETKAENKLYSFIVTATESVNSHSYSTGATSYHEHNSSYLKINEDGVCLCGSCEKKSYWSFMMPKILLGIVPSIVLLICIVIIIMEETQLIVIEDTDLVFGIGCAALIVTLILKDFFIDGLFWLYYKKDAMELIAQKIKKNDISEHYDGVEVFLSNELPNHNNSIRLFTNKDFSELIKENTKLKR